MPSSPDRDLAPRQRTRKRLRKPRLLTGWREWVSLPDLKVPMVKAKVDTGARSSALHAWNVTPFTKGGALWVRFDVHPMQRNNRHLVRCAAAVVDVRGIRNTSGTLERRYIIRSTLQLGNERWPIEISLTNRDAMGFRMLLGRVAIRRRCIVDPGSSFLLRKPSK